MPPRPQGPTSPSAVRDSLNVKDINAIRPVKPREPLPQLPGSMPGRRWRERRGEMVDLTLRCDDIEGGRPHSWANEDWLARAAGEPASMLPSRAPVLRARE